MVIRRCPSSKFQTLRGGNKWQPDALWDHDKRAYLQQMKITLGWKVFGPIHDASSRHRAAIFGSDDGSNAVCHGVVSVEFHIVEVLSGMKERAKLRKLGL
jgi:hypothetical protein